MKMRYQRDLYRVQLCCDTDKEESSFGYPLQMCLRNSVTGLLPCHGQVADGKFSICWDITSRYNVTQVVGEGDMPVELLLRILEALQRAMESMENFLIPCEYLRLDPSCIYLASEGKTASFLCDFENKNSFRATLPKFGEYVLEHMDHRNQEAMRLGYGLYRLAVEETFDREGFARLLQKPRPEPIRQEAMEGRDEAVRIWSKEELPPADGAPVRKWAGREDTDEQRLRREALEAFFSEEEEKPAGILPPKKMVMLCGLAVILGILVMEAIVFFRNGRHVSPGWVIVGAAVMLLSVAALAVMEVFGRWSEKSGENKGGREKRKSSESEINKNVMAEKVRKDGSVKASSFILSAPLNPETEKEEDTSGSTMVLNTWLYSCGEKHALLCCENGKEFALKGDHWLIGKQRAEVDICLEKPTVSRMHARIYRRGETYYIEDLNSRNGTRLEGRMLDGGQPEILKDGSKIVFADLLCTFTIPADL